MEVGYSTSIMERQKQGEGEGKKNLAKSCRRKESHRDTGFRKENWRRRVIKSDLNQQIPTTSAIHNNQQTSTT